MKLLIGFLLPIFFLGLNSISSELPKIPQGQILISSSDESSFVPNPSTNANTMIYYLQGDPQGATSIRFEKDKQFSENKYPRDSKTVFGNRAIYGDTYQQRDRDLGQTFLTDGRSFTVDAVYLRVGPNEVLQNASGARVAIQFFKVTGTPSLNDRGTPGFADLFDRKNSPELDDYLEGESYTPIYFAIGQLPNNLKQGQYMKWDIQGVPLTLESRSHYAFMIMFLDRDKERSLSLYNNYYGNYRPDSNNQYIGHGIRREGTPDFPDRWEERLAWQPVTLGYPDVCTFRDLFFAITAAPAP